jgi:hypothetical protein
MVQKNGGAILNPMHDVHHGMSKDGQQLTRTMSKSWELTRSISRATSHTWLHPSSVLPDDSTRPAAPVQPHSILEGKSLFLLSKDNKLHIFFAKVKHNLV